MINFRVRDNDDEQMSNCSDVPDFIERWRELIELREELCMY